MGQEVTCRVTCPAGSGEARALLESKEVLVRGAFRWKVSLSDLQSVEVRGGRLLLVSPDGVTSLALGNAVAAKWVEKIRNPPSLMKKLGVKAGARFAAMGACDAAFLEECRAAGGVLDEGAPEILFVFAESEADLVRGWNRAASVWVMYPKARRELTEAQVIAAGRVAGMKDTKVVGFSAALTALRFSRAK